MKWLLLMVLVVGCRAFDDDARRAFSVTATEFPTYVRIDLVCEGAPRIFESDTSGVWHQQPAASPFMAARTRRGTFDVAVNLDCLHADQTRDAASIRIAPILDR